MIARGQIIAAPAVIPDKSSPPALICALAQGLSGTRVVSGRAWAKRGRPSGGIRDAPRRPDRRRGAGKGLRLCSATDGSACPARRYPAVANAKSSTGRLDLLTRTITDGGTEFDRIPPGYHGPLYAEICPRSFSVLVRPGCALTRSGFGRATPFWTTTTCAPCTPKRRWWMATR